MEKRFDNAWDQLQFEIITESLKNDPRPENIAFWVVNHISNTLARIQEISERP